MVVLRIDGTLVSASRVNLQNWPLGLLMAIFNSGFVDTDIYF
jgi:hypothetical protein